jgi:voltage-gated sodium channel
MSVKQLVDHPVFTWGVLGVIAFNAVLIGIGTYFESPVLGTLEWMCVWIFVIEIALKFYARTSTKEFFFDGWNLFDLVIVGSAFVPNISGAATVLRVLRIFRILRLVKGIDELRLIVNVLVRSLQSMAYIALLMFICFYVYAIVAVELFGPTQAEYATLHEAFFSLFRSLTAEDWTDLRYDGVAQSNYWLVTAFHVSWVILATFLLINLVVGAIINNYQEVQEIEKHSKSNASEIDKRIIEISQELNELLKARAGKTDET